MLGLLILSEQTELDKEQNKRRIFSHSPLPCSTESSLFPAVREGCEERLSCEWDVSAGTVMLYFDFISQVIQADHHHL